MTVLNVATRVGGRASRARFQLGGVRHGGFVPFTHLPPMPPPEFEPDGSPKKYPLQQPIYDHGYNWETWKLMPVGMFHTVYIGEFARDLPPHWAWLGSIPPWAGIPVAITFGILFANGRRRRSRSRRSSWGRPPRTGASRRRTRPSTATRATRSSTSASRSAARARRSAPSSSAPSSQSARTTGWRSGTSSARPGPSPAATEPSLNLRSPSTHRLPTHPPAAPPPRFIHLTRRGGNYYVHTTI